MQQKRTGRMLLSVLLSLTGSTVAWCQTAQSDRLGPCEFFEFSQQWYSETSFSRFDFQPGHFIDSRDLLAMLRGKRNSIPGSYIEMVSVPGGTFPMGARADDIDTSPNQLPRHPVTLSPYRIGKYEVTNAQYVDVLNWAYERGRLWNSDDEIYAGGIVYANGQALIHIDDSDCQIEFANGVFFTESRQGFSMADHPVTNLTWYGCVAFCYWLSE